MTPEDVHELEQPALEEGNQTSIDRGDHLRLNDLRDVRVRVSADLGNTMMRVRDVLELRAGSVVTLEKLAGEATDIYVNGELVGRGEVVVVGEELHVRISEIIGWDEGQDAADATEG